MRYHQDIRQPPGSQYLCLTRRDTLISPPSALPSPHFRMHPFTSSPTPKPVTHVTRYHQTSPTPIKNYGFPKTDAPVTRVTTPYQYPLLPRGKRGCRCLLGPKPRYNFSVYYANPFLLFLRPLLLSPASHSPALSPSAPRRPGRPLQRPLLKGGGVDKPPLTVRQHRL